MPIRSRFDTRGLCGPAPGYGQPHPARTSRDAVTVHIDYWDGLGWNDSYSSRAATNRQRAYQALIGASHIYTPQAVVDGRLDVLGSDADAMDRALRAAEPGATAAAPVTLAVSDDRVRVRIGAARGRGTAVVVGYDARRETAVRRGENAGRTILQANVVRSVVELGPWTGRDLDFDIPRPEGERFAMLVQAPDGAFLGVAR